MIIQRLFSKKKKAMEENGKGIGLIAGSIAVGKGGNLLGKKITEASYRSLINSELTAKDKDIIKEKLKEKAKKQGIKIINDPNLENSFYMGDNIGKKTRDRVAKQLRNARKSKKMTNDQARKSFVYGRGPVWDSLGKDRIFLGKGPMAGADVLSHELGHAQYLRPGRSKSMVGKVAHKLRDASRNITESRLGKGAIFAHGFQAGVKKEKDKREGKKTGAIDKVRSVALPAALVAPVLVSEGKASLNGLKTMKKLGASKELMSQSRKRLGSAFGTYAGGASKSIFLGGSGELAGRGVSKIMHSDDY